MSRMRPLIPASSPQSGKGSEGGLLSSVLRPPVPLTYSAPQRSCPEGADALVGRHRQTQINRKSGGVGCCRDNEAGVQRDQEGWGLMVAVLEGVGREGGLDEVIREQQSGRRKETSHQIEHLGQVHYWQEEL